MFLEILLIIILLLCGLHYYVRGERVGKYVDKLPGPKAWPIIGNLWPFMVPNDKLWLVIRRVNAENYPLYRLWSLADAYINILHPDDLEIILTSTEHTQKSMLYNLLHPWFGKGLLTSSEAAMGTSLQGKTELQRKYRKACDVMSEILIYRLVRPWFGRESIFKWTPHGRKQQSALKVLHGFSTQIINERKDYHEKTQGKFLKTLGFNYQSEDEVFGIRKRRLAMLDLLIAAQRDGGQIDDLGIREEVDTFVFEGHDTSAMGICFALLLIAEHKDIQARIRTEVDEVFSASDGKLGMLEIQHLTYLERCIKESLRLYPSVPFIARRISQDLHLRNYLIPKGALAHIHVYDIHRDPNYWPEPEKFDPDRFSPENIKERHPFSYIPFSAGPRNCIGQKFAMMELKVIIAYLVYEFYLEPIDLAHKVPLITDLTIRPARPIHIKFVPIRK